MSRHMAPVMLGLTAFPLAAIGIAAYLVVSAGPQMMAVAGAILLLSCCILLAVTVAVVKLQRHDTWLWSQQESLRGLSGQTDDLLARLASVEQRHVAKGHANRHRSCRCRLRRCPRTSSQAQGSFCRRPGWSRARLG